MKAIVFLLNLLFFHVHARHLGVVNGNEVIPHSKPYQVFLEVSYIHFEQLCSGVIVSDKDIITTGRCIAGSDYVTIYAGAHNITAHENTQVLVRGTDYRINDEYDWDYGYNIAIIKLSKPLGLNQFISTIPINLDPGRLVGRMAEISGWGGRNVDERVSPVLRGASAIFVNASVCFAHDFDMTETDVCLSGVNGATTCFTDAGGPVVIDGQLVAILSPKEFHCGQWRSFAAVELSKSAEWLRKNLEPIPEYALL